MMKRDDLLWYGNLGIGPLIARLSPGIISWKYFEAFPSGYFLTRKVSSPGASGGDMGVYGRITGRPLSSLSASGSEAFTTTQDATGRRDAWSSGNSKMNLD